MHTACIHLDHCNTHINDSQLRDDLNHMLLLKQYIQTRCRRIGRTMRHGRSEVTWMTSRTGNCCFGRHVTAREERGTTLPVLFAPPSDATTAIEVAKEPLGHEHDCRKIINTGTESCEAIKSDLRPVQLFRHWTSTRGEQARRQHIMARF